ncbi:uncharacterized protein isoform X1 [Castor canadensis]|uniref:Uncharacterized protein isoform X1 n=1 Tax=Castor canadensis TaxID=51338 RepID=A0AC58KJY6_CASCN
MFVNRIPLKFVPWDVREWGYKPFRGPSGRDKAPGQGTLSKIGVRRRSRPELGYKLLREKVWVPWDGLIVIGKKMELLNRNTQKPRIQGDSKFEYWRLKDVGKPALEEKLGPSQERGHVKLQHSVASASPAPADMGKDSPREVWGQQEITLKTGAESESAGMTAESRVASVFEDRLESSGDNVGTSEGDLRSSGHQLGQNEELMSSGEKRESSGEELRSSEQSHGSSGQRRGSSGEKLRSSGQKHGSSGQRRGSSGQRRGSSREKPRSSEQRRESTGEKLRSSGQRRGSSDQRHGSRGEKLRSSGQRHGSGSQRHGSSGEKLRLSEEKLSASGEKLSLSSEKLRPSEEKLRTDGKDLGSIRDEWGSSDEKLESSGENLEEDSRMGNIMEGEVERVMKVTGDEKVLEVDEMEISFESTEGRGEELDVVEEAEEVDKDVLNEVKDITNESVSVEEKDMVGDGPSGGG